MSGCRSLGAQIAQFRAHHGVPLPASGLRPDRRLRVRVATATRPRTVIGIRADA